MFEGDPEVALWPSVSPCCRVMRLPAGGGDKAAPQTVVVLAEAGARPEATVLHRGGCIESRAAR